MKTRLTLPLAIVVLLATVAVARAHVSERALVMLLPTDVYIPAGVAAVVLTVLALVVMPPAMIRYIFPRRSPRITPPQQKSLADWAGVLSAVVLWGAIAIGLTGPRDPLTNMLPLLVWTIFWIGMPLIQATLGDLWRVINPWRGVYRLLSISPLLPLPNGLGTAPAIGSFLAAAIFAAIHIAPDDPARLAFWVASYWLATFAMMLVFGEDWLDRGEGATVFLGWLARLAPRNDGLWATPGAALIDARPGWSAALLIIVALGVGSFDGLNETFWWLATIGINPLEFPGRSAVVGPNLIGLMAGVIALILIFVLATWLGLRMARAHQLFRVVTPRLALSLLPIALGYHIAHYLTAALVNWQYLAIAVTDPLATGADYLRLGQFYVSTGFFNTTESVRLIWLTQAGGIVLGHMLAVLIGHAIALQALGSHRKAVISQLPIAGFMIAYTFFGLWLLSTPTGM